MLSMAKDVDKIYPFKVKEHGVKDSKGVDDTEESFEYVAEVDNEEELEEWLKNATHEEQIATVQKLADEFRRYVLEPANLGVGTWIKIEGGARKPLEDDEGKRTEFLDRPIKITKENIKLYLISGLLDSDTIIVPTKLSDQNLSNVKIQIVFRGKELPMEQVYAREIGAEHRDVIGSKKHPQRKFRFKNIPINVSHSQNLTQEVEDMLPYFIINDLNKEVRAAFTAFNRRTSSSTEESIENKIKEWLNRGNYGYMTTILEHLHDITEIQNKNVDQRLDLPEDFDINFWVNNSGKMKRNYKQMLKLLIGYASGAKGEENFLNQLILLKKSFLRLDNLKEDYITSKTEQSNELDEELDVLSIEEIDKLTEKERDKYYKKLNAVQEKLIEQSTAQDTVQQVMSEEDKDEFLQRIAEGKASISDEEDELSSDLDDESELSNYLFNIDADMMQDATMFITSLINEYKDFIKYKKMDLSSHSFIKNARKLLTLIKYPNIEDALQTLNNVTEERDEEGNFNEDTKQSKISINKLKEDISNHWDSVKGDFKTPKEADFIKLVNQINLEDVISEAIYNSELNDARHAIVNISSNNLNLVVNTKDKKLELKGKILWSSQALSYIDYKSKSGGAPIYNPRRQFGEQTAGKAMQNKPITYSGTEQMSKSRPFDELRFNFYKDIKTRTQLLESAVQG